MTDDQIMDALFGSPWKFAIGDFVKHRDGGIYRVIAHALTEDAKVPVYVYRSFGARPSFATWTRPRSEMEDGRFESWSVCDAIADGPSSIDEAYRAEHEALINALEGMVSQHVYDNGELDSMCLSSDAEALRMLARVGRVKLTGDGPGRNVQGEWIR